MAPILPHGHVTEVPDGNASVVTWDPKVGWLYRRYMIGLGQTSADAERALRGPLGAAAGWIDRPFSQEQVARNLVAIIDVGKYGQPAELGLLKVVPAVMHDNSAGVSEALRDRLMDYHGRTVTYIDAMRKSAAAGLKPAVSKAGLAPLLPASLTPCYARILEHFDHAHSADSYQKSILQYADFGSNSWAAHRLT